MEFHVWQPPRRKHLYDKPVAVAAGIPIDTALRALDQVLDGQSVYGPLPDLEFVGMLITFGGTTGLGLLIKETVDGYTIENIDA